MLHCLLYVNIQTLDLNSVMLFRNILFVVGCFRRVSDNYISSWKSYMHFYYRAENSISMAKQHPF